MTSMQHSSIPHVNVASSMSLGSFTLSQHIWDPLSIPEQETLRISDSIKHNLDDSRKNLSFGCWKSPFGQDNSSDHIQNGSSTNIYIGYLHPHGILLFSRGFCHLIVDSWI